MIKEEENGLNFIKDRFEVVKEENLDLEVKVNLDSFYLKEYIENNIFKVNEYEKIIRNQPL